VIQKRVRARGRWSKRYTDKHSGGEQIKDPPWKKKSKRKRSGASSRIHQAWSAFSQREGGLSIREVRGKKKKAPKKPSPKSTPGLSEGVNGEFVWERSMSQKKTGVEKNKNAGPKEATQSLLRKVRIRAESKTYGWDKRPEKKKEEE